MGTGEDPPRHHGTRRAINAKSELPASQYNPLPPVVARYRMSGPRIQKPKKRMNPGAESTKDKGKKGNRTTMNTRLTRDLRPQLTVGSLLLVILLLSSMATPVLADPQGSAGTSSDGWKFTAAPYLLIPWMDGKVAVRGRDHEVDVSPGSIFENPQFGAMGYFEARKGSWGTGIDAVYMALGSDVARPSANVDFNQGAYTFTGLRRLSEKFDLLFGVRSYRNE